MDPDREALRKAIVTPISLLRQNDVLVPGEAWSTLVAAARRDLARLEGEPKKASLGELVECLQGHVDHALEDCGGQSCLPLFAEAAAVLRAVVDYREGRLSHLGFMDFLRSLP